MHGNPRSPSRAFSVTLLGRGGLLVVKPAPQAANTLSNNHRWEGEK